MCAIRPCSQKLIEFAEFSIELFLLALKLPFSHLLGRFALWVHGGMNGLLMDGWVVTIFDAHSRSQLIICSMLVGVQLMLTVIHMALEPPSTTLQYPDRDNVWLRWLILISM